MVYLQQMHERKSGFTIVEMIIVVIIIAVLALITVFAFGNWRARAARVEMKQELSSAFSTLKNSRNFTAIYPVNQAGFDAAYKIGGSVTLEYYTADGGATTYCIRASSTSVTTEPKWFIGNATPQPTITKPANCSAAW